MPPVVVNIDGLSRAAKQYDPMLKTLPFDVLDPVMTALEINLLEVGDGDNIETTFERKGGLLVPYSKTTSDQDASEEAVGKFVEMPLTTKEAKAAIKDHIQNYTSDVIVVNGDAKVDDQSKKHPLEALIIRNKVITVGEDQIDACFHSKRDANDASPMGISDGFFTLEDNFVSSGDITEGKGNLEACGSLAAPANGSDITAYTSIKAWLRAAHPSLKKGRTVLYITGSTLMNIKDAAANKFQYLQRVSIDQLQEILADEANIPELVIKTHPCLGTGTRLTLTKPRNLDYGLNLKGNAQFVQVRSPYADPNWVQFWLQFKVGQRIKSLNPKMLMISDGTTASLSLSGDYNS